MTPQEVRTIQPGKDIGGQALSENQSRPLMSPS